MDNKKVEKSFFFLEKLKKEQSIRLKRQKQSNRDKEPNLLNLSMAMVDFMILEQLKIYCAYVSYTVMMHENVIPYNEQDFKLMPAIFDLVKHKKGWHPIIQIYWEIVKLLKKLKNQEAIASASIHDFLNVERLLVQMALCHENSTIMTNFEWMDIYSNLTNYANYHVNHGQDEFVIKSIQYNQLWLEKEIEEDDNYTINTGMFKNIVTLILRLAKFEDKSQYQFLFPEDIDNIFDWARHFVKTHQRHLEPSKIKYRDYCEAFIDFRSGKHKVAFQKLQEMKTVREMFLSLDIKVLQLQLLIEMDVNHLEFIPYETIQDEAGKLRKMLEHDKKKKQRLTYHKDYYWKFYTLYLKYFQFLKTYQGQYTRGNQKYLAQKEALISEMSDIKASYGQWFIDKIDQVKY